MSLGQFRVTNCHHKEYRRWKRYQPISQACLRALGIPIDRIGFSIPPAAYRNKRGTWLSQCSQTPENLSREQLASKTHCNNCNFLNLICNCTSCRSCIGFYLSMSRVRSVSQNDLLESLREGITEKSIVCDRELVGVRKGGGGAGGRDCISNANRTFNRGLV